MKWRKPQPRIHKDSYAALRDAIEGDGLRLFAKKPKIRWCRRLWPAASPMLKLGDFDTAKDAGVEMHKDAAIVDLYNAGWMVHNRVSDSRRSRYRGNSSVARLGALAVMTDFGSSFIAQQLFAAGLFIAAEEAKYFTERPEKVEQLSVWADMVLSGEAKRASKEPMFYWIEVLLRTPVFVPLKHRRAIEIERWHARVERHETTTEVSIERKKAVSHG